MGEELHLVDMRYTNEYPAPILYVEPKTGLDQKHTETFDFQGRLGSEQ
jgi:hypothetical protein